MANTSRLVFSVVTVLSAFMIVSCRQDMQDQPKYLAYRGSDMFPDSLSSRPIVEHTIARGFLREGGALYTGKIAAGKNVTPSVPKDSTNRNAPSDEVSTFPFPITRAVLNRGEERYNIYCSPCHGLTGNGDGMIVRRGFRAPPSYHIDRLRAEPVGHFFDVMTNGFGAMPDYAQQVSPVDRWAIVAYIRALQLSQHATLADVPNEQKTNLK